MADTRAATGLTVQQWDDQFFTEYYQGNQFSELYGTTEAAAIQVQEDLTKKKGDTITFALLNRLTGDATEGSNTLEGNEEDMTSRSHAVTVNKRRHGVRISEMEEQRSAIGLRDAAKSVLKSWAEEDTRDRIIEALASINGVKFADADATARNAWLVDNADRVLFGEAKINGVSGIHATALATIDGTNDICKRASLSLLKRMAITANPKIAPLKDPGNGKRTFIAYAHPLLFRDLRNDMESVMDDTTAQGQAMKLFEGGDLYWDGIIVKELDDAPLVASSVQVSPLFLLGRQALGYAIARRWKSFDKRFDYEDKAGVAIDAIDKFEKLRFGTGAGDTDDCKDHGVATGWFAAVAD